MSELAEKVRLGHWEDEWDRLIEGEGDGQAARGEGGGSWTKEFLGGVAYLGGKLEEEKRARLELTRRMEEVVEGERLLARREREQT